MPTVAFETFNSPSTTRLDPWYNAEDAEQQDVKLADGTYARGTVLGEQIGVSAVQTVTISATGGTFKIIVPTTPLHAGQTTAAIAYNATAATVQSAMTALAAVGVGNVAVTGSAGGPYTITFQNALANLNLVLTTDPASLTGGSGTATVASVTAGSAGTPGTFAAYSSTATDGSQHARCLLRYACVVSSGVVTGISDWGAQSVNAVSAFMRGYFRTEQLVGLDSGAVTDLGATIVQGDILSGVIRVG